MKEEYKREKERYNSAVSRKKDTHEDSYLYQKDVVEVFNDFNGYYNKIIDFIDVIANVSDDDTRFEKTIEKLKNNSSYWKNQISEPATTESSGFSLGYMKEMILAASKAAFDEYSGEFNVKKENAESYIQQIDASYSNYTDLSKDIATYNHKINILGRSIPFETNETKKRQNNAEIDKYKKLINQCKEQQGKILDSISLTLAYLTSKINEMEELLEKALKASA